MEVNNGAQIHVSLGHWDGGDVRCPDLVGVLNGKIAKQIRVGFMRLMSTRCVFAGHYSSKSHDFVVKPFNPVLTYLITLVFGQPNVHTPGTFEGVMQIMLIHQSHQLQVELGFSSGFIIKTRAMNVQNVTLTSDTEI